MEFTLHGSDFTLTPRSDELEEHELSFTNQRIYILFDSSLQYWLTIFCNQYEMR